MFGILIVIAVIAVVMISTAKAKKSANTQQQRTHSPGRGAYEPAAPHATRPSRPTPQRAERPSTGAFLPRHISTEARTAAANIPLIRKILLDRDPDREIETLWHGNTSIVQIVRQASVRYPDRNAAQLSLCILQDADLMQELTQNLEWEKRYQAR